MGDLIDLAKHLNLSPVNTILLAIIFFGIKFVLGKIKDLDACIRNVETVNERQGQSIAFIKGKLEIDEDH